MQDTHDERRIALDPQPLLPREGYFFRLMARLGLREKNIRDEKLAKAAEANRPYREAEARRRALQPGAQAPVDLDDPVIAKGVKALGRIGGGPL